jgi:hypothetical protein
MVKLFVALCAVAASLVVAAPAGATFAPCGDEPARHCTFESHDQFVDSVTCEFPVAGDIVFRNDITEFADGQGVLEKLILNQSTVGTLTANEVTLELNIRETIIVDFVDGIALAAKHVGVLDSVRGPGGPVFLRTGQAAFEVVGGFDGPLIARHGLRADFDPVAFCAAFDG